LLSLHLIYFGSCITFINHLNRYISLRKEEEELLLSKLHYRKINNKEFILKDGQFAMHYISLRKDVSVRTFAFL